MFNLIKFTIKSKKVTFSLAIFVVLLGIYSYYFMPRQEIPELSSPAVQIVTVYTGASAKTVEEQVSKKIEDEIATLDGVEWIQSSSQDNVSIVIGMLNYKVDYEKQWDKLRVQLDNLQKKMPEGVGTFDINTNLVDTNGIIISFSSDKYDNTRLKGFAQDFKTRLLDIKGIKKIEVVGEKENRVEIKLNYNKLNLLGVGIDDVFKLLKAQNVIIPPGDLQTTDGKLNVNVPKSFENLDDFKNTVVSVSRETGVITRLSDIAEVSFAQKSQDTYFIKGQNPAIMLNAQFETGINVVLIGEEVENVIQELKSYYPDDVEINEMMFLPRDVDKSVNSFIVNLLQGVLLVIFVIFVGMGMRNALVVSLSIPLSIAITFVFMGFLKIQLHQVSIAALIIALGMIVDNSIVISDAVQVKINEGHERKLAAYEGAREQFIPVFTSTLTTVAAFSVLTGLPGEAGEFLSTLPTIVIITLSASFFVAMYIIPVFSSVFLREYTPKTNLVDKVSGFYNKIFEFNASHSKLSLIGMFVLVVISVFVFINYVDINMFPYVDRDIIYVDLKADITGNIDETRKLALETQDLLKEFPEIIDTYISVGGSLPRFYMTQDFMYPSDENAQVFAKFDLTKSKNISSREDLKYKIQTTLDRKLSRGYASTRLLEIKIPGSAVEVRVYGQDIKRLSEVSRKIYEYLQSLDTTINVQIVEPNYKYQYQIDIDDVSAIRNGLTKYDIQLQLNMAINGMSVGDLNNGGDNYDIFLETDVKTINDVESFMIKSPITNKKVMLKNIAKVSLKQEFDSIKRYDRKTQISVKSDTIPGIGSSSLQKNVEEFVSKLDLEGVSIQYDGDEGTMAKYLTGLISASMIAVALIYIILLVQFDSFVKPIIVMATVLLAMIGIVVALVLSSTNFTFTVGLGAASLMGVVVNNGILLIEYIDRAIDEGMSVLEACRHSVGQRMRPILLSSVTTIFGLIPLVLAKSSFFTPMAIALMGGLIVATFTTITIIPTMYYVVYSKIESRGLHES